MANPDAGWGIREYRQPTISDDQFVIPIYGWWESGPPDWFVLGVRLVNGGPEPAGVSVYIPIERINPADWADLLETVQVANYIIWLNATCHYDETGQIYIDILGFEGGVA